MKGDALAMVAWGEVIVILSLRASFPLSLLGLLIGAAVATLGVQRLERRSP